MFNGRDLSEWIGDKDIWSVKDGAIFAESTASTVAYNTAAGSKAHPVNRRNLRATVPPEYRVAPEAFVAGALSDPVGVPGAAMASDADPRSDRRRPAPLIAA